MAPPLFIRVFCFIAWTCIGPMADGYGQAPDLPVRQWKAVLTMKRDPRMEGLGAVFDQVIALDSTVRCEALAQLASAGPAKDKRFQIKVRLLYHWIQDWSPPCPDERTVEGRLKEALQLAYELEDDDLIAFVNQELGVWYNRNGQYGLGITHALVAKELQEAFGLEKFNGLASARFQLGYMLYQVREYPEAKDLFLEAIRGFRDAGAGRVDTLDAYYAMNAWNNVGLCYRKLADYDSAMWAFEQALVMSRGMKNEFWTGLVEGNIGEVHFALHRYDTAEVLLARDLAHSLAGGELDNAANALQQLAQIDAIRGRATSGLDKLREAMQLLRRKPSDRVKAHVYNAYARVFSELGAADSVYAYMQKYLALHDSLEWVAAHNSTEIVRLRLDNQASVNRILLLNKEKRRITLIRNFTIGIILLLAGLAYVDFQRQKAKISLQKEVALERQRRAELEAATSHAQLLDFTQMVIEKSALVDHLQQQLLEKENTAEQHQIILDLTHQPLLTDADWTRFKDLFERAYPGFFPRLRARAPEITQAELRMAALLRLQLSTKEAAALLGVAPDSVHKTRQRLKQRLQLPQDADLDQAILSL